MKRQFPTDRPSKKQKHTRRDISLATVLFLLLAFLTAGFVTDWFGLYGPVTKIALAGAKTFKADSFTADFMIDSGNVHVEGTLQLYVDLKSEAVEAYLEADADSITYIAAIYDNTLIYGTKNKLFTKDISTQLRDYFRRQKESPQKIRSYDDLFQLLLDLIPEKLQETIDESYLDLDETKLLLKSFLTKKFNRTSWLKDHVGYESYRVDGVRYHRFQSEKGQFLAETVTHFEPAFKSEKLLMQLQKNAETMQTSGASTQMLIAIEDGCLRKVEAVTTGAGKNVSFTLSFREIGSTRPDQDPLSNFIQP